MERHIYCSLIFGYTKGVGCSIKGGGGGGVAGAIALHLKRLGGLVMWEEAIQCWLKYYQYSFLLNLGKGFKLECTLLLHSFELNQIGC